VGRDEEDRATGNGWDFGQIRRRLGPNLGLGINANSATSIWGGPGFPNIRGRNQSFIQQLFSRREFVKPLIERNEELASKLSTLAREVKKGPENGNVRLENLKKSFKWVKNHRIPIHLEGVNSYIASLLTHGEYEEALKCTQSYFIPAEMNISGDKSTKPRRTTKPRLDPNINTIQIIHDYGDESFDEALQILRHVGGSKLENEWERRRSIFV
jgi:hypothetical protein